MRLTPLGLVLASLFLRQPVAAIPAPELVRLDAKLDAAQRERQSGVLAPEAYAEFLERFRADLSAAADAAPPSAENDALHARILSRLEKSAGRERFDAKDYPAALAAADAALKIDPNDREALTLKHFSSGRAAMNAPQRVASPAAAVHRSRKIRFAAADPASLPFKLPVKVAPAAAPPLLDDGQKPAAPGPLPLLPLAGAALAGLAAYGISRGCATYESEDGLDDAHPRPAGRWQKLVAGAALAGAVGGLIYLGGAAAVSAAPVAWEALAPAATEAAVPIAQEAAPAEEEVLVQKGEILNRVWHSEWTPGSTVSGPEGFSYCRGACLPIHAAHAIERRGLGIGVVNDARQGGLYRVTEDVVAIARRAVGGEDQEILFRSADDLRKLEPIRDSLSTLPAGR